MGHRATKPPVAPSQSLGERATAARLSAARHMSAANEPTQFSNARAFADAFDFSLFSTADLARLYELVSDASRYWLRVTNMPWCIKHGSREIPEATVLGHFASFEEERLAFLQDRCVRELRQRQPADDDERDHILSTRILHEIGCAGQIDTSEEPTLLIDALKAWG